MVVFIWLEVMILSEVELSTAMEGAGTLCVPVAGTQVEKKHDWSVAAWGFPLVKYRI